MSDRLILAIAPTLRGLLAEGAVLPVVSFSEAVDAAALSVTIAAEADDAAVLAALKAAVEAAKQKTGKLPSAVAVPGVGTFRAETSAATGRVAGKIAVITGAAQGFGLEIAQSFAANGGSVVLTDMNLAGAQAAAEALNAKLGAKRAIGLPVNVTDGASVAAMVLATVKAFGGFDLFLANAGVVKAGSVKVQAEKDFDFVTNVNYKGFFLCTQQAAPVQARQAAAKPGYFSDIIQINSKSGLEGSNKNGAYAGSKFGGIGLVQSFALELVEDRIKVNAICPGNFFDGPLWSDPEKGLFVQYLKSGKIPGAKTVDDVKKAYESKVPMNRGCRTADVMKAVFYLIEQEYETGQAVPVTGGQVMLN